MCLDRIIGTSDNSEIITAWKVFKIRKGRVRPEYRDYGFPYRIGSWNEANVVPVSTDEDHERYDSGFHAFHTRKDARIWALTCGDEPMGILRVKIRGPKTFGRQSAMGVYLTVVVAREMLIIPGQLKIKRGRRVH